MKKPVSAWPGYLQLFGSVVFPLASLAIGNPLLVDMHSLALLGYDPAGNSELLFLDLSNLCAMKRRSVLSNSNKPHDHRRLIRLDQGASP